MCLEESDRVRSGHACLLLEGWHCICSCLKRSMLAFCEKLSIEVK